MGYQIKVLTSNRMPPTGGPTIKLTLENACCNPCMYRKIICQSFPKISQDLITQAVMKCFLEITRTVETLSGKV